MRYEFNIVEQDGRNHFAHDGRVFPSLPALREFRDGALSVMRGELEFSKSRRITGTGRSSEHTVFTGLGEIFNGVSCDRDSLSACAFRAGDKLIMQTEENSGRFFGIFLKGQKTLPSPENV